MKPYGRNVNTTDLNTGLAMKMLPQEFYLLIIKLYGYSVMMVRLMLTDVEH